MKSILIVTEQFTIGGLETHICGEISQLIKKGVQVHLVTGKNFNIALLPIGLSSLINDIPLDPTATPDELLIAINRLRQIIYEQSIDYMHVHPFTSIIPAIAAAELESIPVAITLHGPASLTSYGPLYDFLFKHIILPNSELVITVSPEVKRLASIYTDEQCLTYIPNSVSFVAPEELNTNLDEVDPRWVVVSRLDQFKTRGITDFCVKAKAAGIPHVLVVGDGPAEEEFLQELEQHGLSDYVNLCGASDRVQLLMKRSAGVAGMGRVILEGIACQKPVVLVGYDGVKGVLDKALLEASADSNFSGRGLPTINTEDFIRQFRKNSDLDYLHLHDVAKNSLNEVVTWSKFYDLMKAARPAKATAISGLYLSLSDNPISHLIPYLHSVELLDLISAVICGKKYYESRLSAAVLFCRQRMESASLNQTVVERDGQIANLNQAVAERDDQIAGLNQAMVERDKHIANLDRQLRDEEQKIRNLLLSTSWRITSPLRFIKILLQSVNSAEARYRTLKSLYWHLPGWTHVLLNKYRYRYVMKYRHISKPQSATIIPVSISQPHLSIDWINKLNKAAKVVLITCGFEFDELINQRPINAAKYFSKNGFTVLYVAWQWSSSDQLLKGIGEVYPNVIQVPLFNFIAQHETIDLSEKVGYYILTMPAEQLIQTMSSWRQKGGSLIYDIMDDWQQFYRAGQAPWYKEAIEKYLVMNADFVTAVSPVLREKFLGIRSDIHVIGNGYSPEILGAEYQNVARKEVGNKKIIGYFGHLTDAWFDWRLVFEIAVKMPDVIFELIGYGEPDWVQEKAAEFKNINLLGKVYPSDLHIHVARWSVGIIPFTESDLSDAVDPIKIYEYLYFGLPVVVTGIAHLKDYPCTYVANRNNIFNLLDAAFERGGELEHLDSFLKSTTWHARFERLSTLIQSYRTIGILYSD